MDSCGAATCRPPSPLLAVGLLALVLTAYAAPSSAQERSDGPQIVQGAFSLDGGGEMLYALALPSGYSEEDRVPRPLILALHPGGRAEYYGSWFMQSIVEPALRDWDAIIVAPDVPDRSWEGEAAERAVLDLIAEVRARYPIDPTEVLVTGFSMGGRGTWFFATRHSDLFTGAIVMAGSRGDLEIEGLGELPIYFIHSPDDEVVPYEPVVETAQLLADRGHPVQLLRLDGATHGMMGDYVAPLQAAGEWMMRQWGKAPVAR